MGLILIMNFNEMVETLGVVLCKAVSLWLLLMDEYLLSVT